ncbi:zf-HC2 domain-containing protein [Streptomyces phaeoluteigriseus]|uniref:Zf-HC2 domain-containing protein n=1 Tax=Streptomyces phaeoluteigriseus TaxID=114686 RepID=A0ABY4ZL73_9ACTN|nr:zf-HC2 domain-containing protein [Streptomyces phaeoluteigriseus]USQ89118.1 zf-HC2 domain-containing protein [Streptomyces phaeoluteigriseus]
MTWHVADEDLRAYARGELAAPLLWSADTHLTGCAQCRSRLAGAADPVALDEAWERLDAELDAPRPSLVERLLVRLGVADHTARLLTATPVLRRSWLLAVMSLLVMTVLAVHLVDRPALFLALAPLLPLGGVALSYGPALDPSYEMAVVAPMHGFRLLMIRTVAVLTAGLAFNGLATLALPEYGLLALTWLLPALALTATGLALTPRLGPVLAPGLVGGAWLTLLVVAQSQAHSHSTLVPFTAAGQSAAAAIAALATVLLYQTRDRFDTRPAGGFVDGGAV